jgi:hypothetical protein
MSDHINADKPVISQKTERAQTPSAARRISAPSPYQSTLHGAFGYSGLLPPRPIYYR